MISVFGLIVLGLTLACQPRDSFARYLYSAAVAASLLAAAIATFVVLDTGTDDFVATAGPVPAPFGNGYLLRTLAATFVVLAALWFGALAASRVERQTDAQEG